MGVSLLFEGDTYMSPALEGWKLSADVNKTSQVFRNLVSNALKFTEKGGCVTVHSTFVPGSYGTQKDTPSHPAMLRVTVKDNGVGISKVLIAFEYILLYM